MLSNQGNNLQVLPSFFLLGTEMMIILVRRRKASLLFQVAKSMGRQILISMMFNSKSFEKLLFSYISWFRKSLVDAFTVAVWGIMRNMSLKEFLKEREGLFSVLRWRKTLRISMRSKCTCILLFYYQ